MMKRLLPTCLALLALAASSGCLFHRKNPKPKDNPKIATELEQGFKQRWIEKRVAELGTQGVAPAQAQAQAAKEFSERYEYLQPEGRK